MKQFMLDKFKEVFGSCEGVKVYFAPGRVNLIGEHTDYNGGHVFPVALTIGTYAAVRLRDDHKTNMFSANFDKLGVFRGSIDLLKPCKEDGWTNYPKGVIWAFEQKGMHIDRGFDVVYWGNIPNGSGLSSSASIEVLTGFWLKDLFGFAVDNKELAVIGQFSENNYNGVNCGIMDQFAIAMGRQNSAIFLDTNTMLYEYVPIKLDGISLVVVSSNKKRGLGDSKYNERRSECEEALRRIQKHIDIPALGSLDEETFDKCVGYIGDEILTRRAKHAVYENSRTVKAVNALNANDIELFGQLMIMSHKSLRDDYEVTGRELDTLVSEALKVEGVVGARMTGAGFGGCTVNLVRNEAVDDFIKKVGEAYLNAIGYKADFYVVSIGDGPCEL